MSKHCIEKQLQVHWKLIKFKKEETNNKQQCDIWEEP